MHTARLSISYITKNSLLWIFSEYILWASLFVKTARRTDRLYSKCALRLLGKATFTATRSTETIYVDLLGDRQNIRRQMLLYKGDRLDRQSRCVCVCVRAIFRSDASLIHLASHLGDADLPEGHSARARKKK